MTRKEVLKMKSKTKTFKRFIEKLEKVEDEKTYNVLKTNDKYKDIFEQFPEFKSKNWRVYDENGKPTTSKYNYKWILNTIIGASLQEKDKIWTIVEKINKDDPDFSREKLNEEIIAIVKSREAEDKRNQDQQHKEELEKTRQEGEEKTKEEIEKTNKQHKEEIEKKEEEKRNIKAENNQRIHDTVAKTKHKAEEETRKYYEERLKQAEEQGNIINDRLKPYLRDHYIIDSPKTREELYKKVSEDPNLKANSEERINKYVNYILGKQLNRIITSKTKIIKTAKLFGNDANYLSKLDPTVREAVLKYQTELINKTNMDKKNKYMLPKKYIKFEKAINDHKVNPLVLRGLYVK